MPLLATPTGQVPPTDPIKCEVCQKSTPLAQAHSIAVNYNMPGQLANGTTLTAYQCPNYNHYACTHEHAVIAALACLFEHIEAGNHSAKGLSWGGAWATALKTAIANYTVKSGAGGV